MGATRGRPRQTREQGVVVVVGGGSVVVAAAAVVVVIVGRVGGGGRRAVVGATDAAGAAGGGAVRMTHLQSWWRADALPVLAELVDAELVATVTVVPDAADGASSAAAPPSSAAAAADLNHELTLPPLAARYLREPGGAVVYVTARSRARCLSEYSSARRWRDARARLRRGRYTVGSLAAGLARLLTPHTLHARRQSGGEAAAVGSVPGGGGGGFGGGGQDGGGSHGGGRLARSSRSVTFAVGEPIAYEGGRSAPIVPPPVEAGVSAASADGDRIAGWRSLEAVPLGSVAGAAVAPAALGGAAAHRDGGGDDGDGTASTTSTRSADGAKAPGASVQATAPEDEDAMTDATQEGDDERQEERL